MKKKKVALLVCLLIILVVIAVIFASRLIGKKPFSKLSINDVSAATVQLLPPDETVQVTEIAELVDALNDVVIYEQDNSFSEYSGQSVIYTIALNDGQEIIVNAYRPFIVIDGVGYRAKNESCEKLSQLANELIS